MSKSTESSEPPLPPTPPSRGGARIAYIAGQFPLRSETFVYREVRELRARGWEVTCVSVNHSQDVPDDSSDLTHNVFHPYDHPLHLIIGAKRSPSAFAAATGTFGQAVVDAFSPGEPVALKDRLKLLIQRNAGMVVADHLRCLGIEHIHCHFAHAPTTIGMYAAMQLGVPFSFTGHANDLFQRRALLKRKLERAKFVSCISEEHRKLYNSIHARSDADYPIIRCGVDISAFTADPRPTTHDPRTILTVCRLVEKKGVDTLIRAFSQLASRNSQLLIAGDGPQRAELEQIAQQSGRSEQIRFLGAVSNDRVRELLQSSDIFALPCRVDRNGDKDGIPVVLMEAMACGLPVVSGDLPAIRELVIDNTTGLLVDGTQVEPTKRALDTLLTDPATASRLAAAGREHVVGEFSLTTNVDRLEAAIQQRSK